MNSTTRGRSVAALAGGLGLALVLAACTAPPENGGPTGTPGGGDDNGNGGVAEGCEAFEQYGDLSGTTVTIYSSIRDTEGEWHNESYDQFRECTGATVEYEGSGEFEAQLPVRIQAGNAPDIAYIPQPGLLQTLVNDFPGAVVEVGELAASNVDEYYASAWRDYGTVDGTFYATPLGANVKSFVWYSPDAFAEGGYEVPQTWEELLELSDQIVADGGTPWCEGIGSGDATGWPATDWLEDILLRSAGPEVYDQWVSNEIPFTDERVAEALDMMGQILKNEDYVNGGFGGVQSIATTEFGDAGGPILDGQCYMHKQASFYQSFWTNFGDVEVGENGDVFAFYFPAMEGADDQPLLGGGEFVAAFDERPEVQAFQAFLTSPEWVNAHLSIADGWVSANSAQDTSLYSSPIDALSAQLLADTDRTFRFDGSDLMPAAVGAGSFWREMTNWIANDKPDEDVLADIQASWP